MSLVLGFLLALNPRIAAPENDCEKSEPRNLKGQVTRPLQRRGEVTLLRLRALALQVRPQHRRRAVDHELHRERGEDEPEQPRQDNTAGRA